MAGKISEMSAAGAGQDSDRLEVTRDPTGSPETLFHDLASIGAHINSKLAHGIMSVQAGVAAEPTVDSTPRNVTAWNVDGLEKNMTVDSTTGNDITANVAGVYIAAANISFVGSSGDTFRFELFKNGVATGFAMERKIGTGGDHGSSPIIGLISLVATDTVEVFQSTVDGNALTISEAQLAVIRISA